MLQPETALSYVNEVLKKDPEYFHAVLLKGEILYSMWDLERAMLCFVDGRRLRQENVDCIKGVHKVKMDLEVIAAYRESFTISKQKCRPKRKRKSMTPSPASKSFLTTSQSNSSISRRASSALSLYSKEKSSVLTDKEDVRHQKTTRPVTSHVSRRSHSKSDGSMKISSEPTDQKTVNVRPKTAAARKNRERAEAYTSEWFAFSPSASHIDSPLLLSKRSPDASTESLSYSLSSSVEDVPKVESLKQDLPRVHPSTARSKSARERPKSCIAPSISRSLSQDKKFLHGILRDKGLKRAQTPYTKRVLRIARDAHKFVTEREKYWKNRERFIRYATPDAEDDLRKSLR